MQDALRLAKARVDAFARASQDRRSVAMSMADSATGEKLRMVVKPPNISGSLRKAGIVLLLTPDPFTAIPGTALLGASYAMKRRQAADLGSLARETARTMQTIRDLRSLL
ncbi:MAG: hypothetical protein OK474_09630 [Thaumarchaeota archaeon]|nr:hypothetical protein [Nitrososphaerota archaeon]